MGFITIKPPFVSHDFLDVFLAKQEIFHVTQSRKTNSWTKKKQGEVWEDLFGRPVCSGQIEIK